MEPLKAKVSPIIMMDFGETREKKNGPQSLDSGFRHKEKKQIEIKRNTLVTNIRHFN